MNITLCSACDLGKGTFPDRLRHALAREGLPARVSLTECMSGCARPSTVAVRDAGKTAYLFGDLTEADLADLVNFVRLYTASADGTFADARPLGALRMKALARIPG
jgi:predicted metal-binding protein